MRKANIALIGCGYWGARIIETCIGMEEVAVIKLFDISPVRKSVIQKLYPDIHFYNSLEEIIQDKTIDAVIIATELSSHYEISKQLLSAKKPVLCEKPLAFTARQCQKLGRISAKNATTLMVGHTYLYNYSILQTKQILDDKSIGTIKQLHFQRCNFGPIRNDTDVVYDLATHDISIANFLINALPLSVSAVGNYILKGQRIDTCDIHLNYPNSISVNISVSWIEPVKSRLIKIIGERGAIYFDDMKTENKVILYQYDSFLSSDMDNTEKEKSLHSISFPSLPQTPLYNEINHFIESVFNRLPPRSDWENGYNVVRIIEAIEKSIVKNGKTIKV